MRRALLTALLAVAITQPVTSPPAAAEEPAAESYSAEGHAAEDSAVQLRTIKRDWESSCPELPASQGRDGFLFVLPDRLATDVWFADMRSYDAPAVHNLDMYFYDQNCKRLMPSENTADADAHERSEMPVGTRFVLGVAHLGAPYTLSLHISFVSSTPPPPPPPPPGGAGQPAPCVLPEHAPAPASADGWPSTSPSLTYVGTRDHDAVAAASPQSFHVGGFYSGMHATRDAGTTWSSTAGPQSIRAVNFVDAEHGWAAGSGTTMFLTRNGGVSWTACAFDSQINAGIFDIEFVDREHGWLVGKEFGAERPLIYRTEDGGATWSAQDPGGLTSGVVTSVDFVDRLRGFAVGPSVGLTTTDGGDTWTPMDVGTKDLQAVVITPDSVVAATFGGSVYRSGDMGGTWKWLTTLPCCPKSLSSVGGAIFISGMRGLLAASFDGGTSWVRQSVGGVDLGEVVAVGERRAVAVGDGGLVVRLDVPPPSPPAAMVKNYLGRTNGTGTFSPQSPVATDDDLMVDLPGYNAHPGQEYDPTWRGQVDGTIQRIDLDFWQRSAEDALAYGELELVVWTGTGTQAQAEELYFFRSTPVSAGPARVTAVFEALNIDPRGQQVSISLRDPLADGTTVVFGSQQHPSSFTINSDGPSAIASCAPDATVSLQQAAADDPCLSSQWGLHQIAAPSAWGEVQATGRGIVAAAIDSGIDLGHPDFACPGKVLELDAADLADDGGSVQDGNGHGTHVAGIIGACTDNGEGVAGVAPAVTVLPVQIFAADGTSSGRLAEAIELATNSGAHVINMSLGYGLGLPPGPKRRTSLIGPVSMAMNPEVEAAIDHAVEAGVVLVASAGNSDEGLCGYPALAEDVVCVTAVGPTGLRSGYANFATKADGSGVGPSLAAPGGTGESCENDVLSTWIGSDSVFCSTSSGYEAIAGTSMAAPHVTGVAALLYERLGGQRNAMNAQTVVTALTSTAREAGMPGWDPVYGSGLLDAAAAVQAVTPVAPPPQGTVLTFTSRSATFGQHSDGVLVEARLTGADGAPIPGAPVDLVLGAGSAERVVSDEHGLAAALLTLSGPPEETVLRAQFDGDAERAPTTVEAPFVVQLETTQLSVDKHRNLARALLRDDDDTPVPGRTVVFFADGRRVGSSVTGSDGVAYYDLRCHGRCVPSAAFEGDGYYSGSRSY